MMAKINIDKTAAATQPRVDAQRTLGVHGAPVQERPQVQEQDRVEITGRSGEVARLVDQVKAMPETRHEKVAHVRHRIAEGKFDPPSPDIADAIIKEEGQ
jgi:flagellar biosynthesis anti-sigma factor FlgM